jgi:hypothetical protein
MRRLWTDDGATWWGEDDLGRVYCAGSETEVREAIAEAEDGDWYPSFGRRQEQPKAD